MNSLASKASVPHLTLLRDVHFSGEGLLSHRWICQPSPMHRTGNFCRLLGLECSTLLHCLVMRQESTRTSMRPPLRSTTCLVTPETGLEIPFCEPKLSYEVPILCDIPILCGEVVLCIGWVGGPMPL